MSGEDKPTGSHGDPTTSQTQKPEPSTQGADTGGQGAAPDPAKLTPAEFTALQKKISELESDNKKYRDERRAAEEKQKKEKEEEAKKRGEFESLLNQKESLFEAQQKENEYLKKTVENTLKMQLGQLSAEDVQEFNNYFGNLTPAEQFEKFAIWSPSKKQKSAANALNLPGTPASQAGNSQKLELAFRAEMDIAKSSMDHNRIQWLSKNHDKIIQGKMPLK